MIDIHQKRQQKTIPTTNHVEKQESNGGKKMGKATSICEQCGREDTRCSKHFGKDVCSSCAAMRGFVKNKPDLIVEALQEFHGETYLPVQADSAEAPGEALAARAVLFHLDQLYALLERAGAEGWNEQSSDEELWAVAMQYIDGLGRSCEIDKQRLAQQLERPAGSNDNAFLGELAAHLGMEKTDQHFTAAEIIEGVDSLSMAFAQSQRNCNDLTRANNQQREQLNELTRQLTTASIVGYEKVDTKDGLLLDAALAALSGDTKMVAHNLELMREKLA